MRQRNLWIVDDPGSRTHAADLARRAPALALLLLLGLPPPTPLAAGAPVTTGRANVSSAGKEAKSWSGYPSISGNGRWVAFETASRKLVKGDTNGEADVFVNDRTTGKTERISVSSARKQANDWSGYASISRNGRFVAFTSVASNLVEDDTNGKEDVFVRDRETGTTERVSVSSAGHQGNAGSGYSSMSADGRFVAFASAASNLVDGDTNGRNDLFVHDRTTRTTTRISVSSEGEQADDDSDGVTPTAMSADGRLVTFTSWATNLVEGDTNGVADVFVHDRTTGLTRRVSVSTAAVQGDMGSTTSALSADGRFVAFQSSASNLVSGDTNGRADVFVHERSTGITTRVSLGSTGAEADGDAGNPTLSADGRFVAFDSWAENLVAGDDNQTADVFVRDRKKGKTRRVSLGENGGEGNGASELAWISASGRFVVFQSDASDLIAGDTNLETDVYVRGPLR